MVSYKEEHERFVSGHNGTTVVEVSLLTLAPSASVLIRDVLLLMFGLHQMPLCNGLVCPEARGKFGTCRSVKDLVRRVIKSLQSSLPLLVFGVGRLLAVKGTDYHEHVTEYGVHWNFFFTLAVVKVVCTVLFCICPVRFCSFMSVGIMAVYQYSLLYMGLSDFILHGPGGTNSRAGFVNANREGIFSSVGYVVLYLVGAHIGRFLFSQHCYATLQLSAAVIQPVSRRMANLSFVLWMVGLSSQVLASCLLTDLLSTFMSALAVDSRKKLEDNPKTEEEVLSKLLPSDPAPCLMTAINFNGLFFFLLSNILTGLVNFTVPTLYTSDAVAVCILHVYLFVLCAVIMVMFKMKIATRFW
ncbi:hypothetical protein BaRGS_00015863 [Batillaria attramentaria]|uniref:Phosphatidylinositol-glycan biosynthesis class W protein n=1 Tax=Batillaria attramentaria TaxID=370345 RepID=A0ABD0L0N3_9CAEN